MRIAIAHSFYRRPGGEDGYVRRLAQLLARRHDVALVARHNADLPGPLRAAVQMIYSPERRREFERAIDDFRPDVVHLHNAYPAWGPAVHLAAERRNVPLVMTVHNLRLRCPNGLMFTEGEVCRRCTGGVYLHGVVHRCFESRSQGLAYSTSLWLHRYPGRLERRVARFIAPSEFMAARLRTWGFPPGKVSLVRSFSDHFRASAVPSPEAHGLFVGRISHEKGLKLLVRALALAGDPPFRIVGDGPLRDEIQRLIVELGLKNASLVGWVEPAAVHDEMARARYVVLPSLCEENAPLAALDALAIGRPIIVSDRGGLPELADEGRGIVTRAGDEADLSRALSRLANDPTRCAATGAAGAQYARERLNPDDHLAALEAVYSGV